MKNGKMDFSSNSVYRKNCEKWEVFFLWLFSFSFAASWKNFLFSIMSRYFDGRNREHIGCKSGKHREDFVRKRGKKNRFWAALLSNIADTPLISIYLSNVLFFANFLRRYEVLNRKRNITSKHLSFLAQNEKGSYKS